MNAFVEGRLEFTFGARTARKRDDEPAYRNGIARLHETKATDFVALKEGQLLCLEVKDFRGHRIENKARLSTGELAIEVSQKVRDTLAGLIGARRTMGDGDEWKAFVEAAGNATHSLHVILWLEEDLPPRSAPGARELSRNTLTQELKKQLRRLTTHVFVASLDRSQAIADIRVKNASVT